MKNNKQVNSNYKENINVGNQENGSVEIYVENSSSIINHENTADIQENAGNKKVNSVYKSYKRFRKI